MASWVGVVHRIIPAICEQVASKRTFSNVQLRVCVDEPPNHRVIIPALQIVKTRFVVVIIPAVSDRVYIADACGVVGYIRAAAVFDGYQFAPGVIGICGNDRTGIVDDMSYVALRVSDILVIRGRPAVLRIGKTAYSSDRVVIVNNLIRPVFSPLRFESVSNPKIVYLR